MGKPHTRHLGAALRLARAAYASTTRQPMTTAHLAASLPLNSGFFSRFAQRTALAQALDDIEAGGVWPFTFGQERGFILACAHALSGGNSTIEQDLRYALSTAAADDLRIP